MTSGAQALSILYVGTLPPHPGGSAILAAQLLLGFADAGHRVRAIAPTTESHVTEPELTGVEVHRFPMPAFEMSPDQAPPAGYREAEGREIRRLYNRLTQVEKPTVVIIGRESFSWHVTELARTSGVPSVLWVQGGSLWGMRSGSLPPEQRRQLLAQMSQVGRVVTVAEHIPATLAEMGIAGAYAIPNGVNLNHFSPDRDHIDLRELLDIPRHHLLVLHASNMKHLKRPGDCVSAAARIMQTESDVTWVLLGDGPALDEVRTQATEAGLERHMRFPGWVSHDDMPAWLAAADVVIMPSTAEALALVYLETMATGRVLVASDIPAARELISDDENGLLFPVGDVECLAQQLLRLIADPALRRRIGARARATALEYDIRTCIIDHLSVLVTESRHTSLHRQPV
jgi:glycosyltransferase involved in cell wall biosynthesis